MEELKGAIVTLGPTTQLQPVTTSSPAERGLTDSEYKAAWALVADINQYVEEGEHEFYLEPRWIDANGYIYRLRDGFAQSTIDTVKQNELNEYRKAVNGTKLNPYDAMNVARKVLRPAVTARRDELRAINEQITDDLTAAIKRSDAAVVRQFKDKAREAHE